MRVNDLCDASNYTQDLPECAVDGCKQKKKIAWYEDIR